MLTKDQMLARYDFLGGRLAPDRLTRKSHARYVEHAERMLQVYRHGAGLTRAELHREVTQILAADEDCPVRRVDAFCKLLDDVSEFERDRRGAAAELRRQVFRTAARSHPLVRQADRLFEHAEEEVKQRIAHELGRPWAEIDRDLFADIMEFHRLERFDGYPDGPALLARYNVAQVQVALYGATAMNVWATGDFKTILRYAKLAKLMHSITRSGENEYLMRFDGPASVLRETRRYGVNMAKFLPALIACRGWRMSATVPVGKHDFKLRVELSDADGLHSHLPPPDEFDSDFELEFSKSWGEEPRDGWMLNRELRVLHASQRVFLPDFAFQRTDGTTVLMEIIGFWTPEYLASKAETLKLFAREKILLAVAKSAVAQLPPLPPDTIVFGSKLKVDDVLAALSRRASE